MNPTRCRIGNCQAVSNSVHVLPDISVVRAIYKHLCGTMTNLVWSTIAFARHCWLPSLFIAECSHSSFIQSRCRQIHRNYCQTRTVSENSFINGLADCRRSIDWCPQILLLMTRLVGRLTRFQPILSTRHSICGNGYPTEHGCITVFSHLERGGQYNRG